MVQGIIMGYLQGGGRQYTSHVIVKVLDLSAKSVHSLIGKRVVYKDRRGNIYVGRIVAKHGARNPLVLVRFKRNLPGQAIGGVVDISS